MITFAETYAAAHETAQEWSRDIKSSNYNEVYILEYAAKNGKGYCVVTANSNVDGSGMIPKDAVEICSYYDGIPKYMCPQIVSN